MDNNKSISLAQKEQEYLARLRENIISIEYTLLPFLKLLIILRDIFNWKRAFVTLLVLIVSYITN
jgi:hypothetical protein